MIESTKVKILAAKNFIGLEDEINIFINEEVEDCDVKDIKFEINEGMFYAFIMYH